MHYFGLCGLPRRVCIYECRYNWVKMVCTVGSFISAFSGCFFIFILWESMVSKKEVLGSYKSSGLVDYLMSPVACHNDYFCYPYSVDYTYGVYYMRWIDDCNYVFAVG